MNKFIEDIISVLKEQVDLSAKDLESLVEVPPDEKLGDYAFPCFVLARRLKNAPDKIAAEIAPKLRTTDLIGAVYPIGPYINFKVNRIKLAEFVLTEVLEKGESYGSDEIGEGKTIVIDFSSPNIAKPFGIGHLRTTMVGNALHHIYRKLGFSVVRINHLGDWGTQFGKIILAYKMWGEEDEFLKDPIATLYDLYVRFHKEEEKDQKLEEEARAWFKRLEDGDKEAAGLWEKFRECSLKEFDRVYRMLGIQFDSYAGESFYNQLMPLFPCI